MGKYWGVTGSAVDRLVVQPHYSTDGSSAVWGCFRPKGRSSPGNFKESFCPKTVSTCSLLPPRNLFQNAKFCYRV